MNVDGFGWISSLPPLFGMRSFFPSTRLGYMNLCKNVALEMCQESRQMRCSEIDLCLGLLSML